MNRGKLVYIILGIVVLAVAIYVFGFIRMPKQPIEKNASRQINQSTPRQREAERIARRKAAEARERPRFTPEQLAEINQGMGLNSNKNKTTQNNNTPTPKAKVGESVYLDEVRWKILEIKNLGNRLNSTKPYVPDKTTKGYFLYVCAEVENLSKNPAILFTPRIKDDQGREFLACPITDVWEWVPKDKRLIAFEDLNPNVPFIFVAIYELPSDAKSIGLQEDQGFIPFAP